MVFKSCPGDAERVKSTKSPLLGCLQDSLTDDPTILTERLETGCSTSTH
jgi:hypothetical protein